MTKARLGQPSIQMGDIGIHSVPSGWYPDDLSGLSYFDPDDHVAAALGCCCTVVN